MFYGIILYIILGTVLCDLVCSKSIKEVEELPENKHEEHPNNCSDDAFIFGLYLGLMF